MNNEKTGFFKGLLGIEGKERTAPLVDDTVEETKPLDFSAAIKALETDLEEESEARKEDPSGWACTQLETFKLSRGAKTLLDRALDNLSKNTGANIADDDAKQDIKLRAELIAASGNDLNVLLVALTEECPILEQGGTVYSLLFNVMKAATFEANLDYRRFLDPAADFDLVGYMKPVIARGEDGSDWRQHDGSQFETDVRSETSPMEGQTGHATRAEVLLEQAQELYGREVYDISDVIICALRDLRWYLQLLSESFGWDVTRPMPYLFVTELDGSFTSITDAMQALDVQELRRQAARAKKREKTAKVMGAAAERARAMLSRAAAKTA